MAVGTISPRSLYASTSNVAGFAALVSLGRCLAANVGHLHLALLRRLLGTDLRVAIRAPLPHGGNFVSDFLVACAAAQERLQVMTALGEEAGEERALGGEAHARATRAE